MCPPAAVPREVFEMLQRAKISRHLKACKEINIAFIPYEEQVNGAGPFGGGVVDSRPAAAW